MIFETFVCVCVRVRACVHAWSQVSNEIKPTSYFFICCKGLPIPVVFLSSCYNEIPDITVVLGSSECLTIGRCLNLL